MSFGHQLELTTGEGFREESLPGFFALVGVEWPGSPLPQSPTADQPTGVTPEREGTESRREINTDTIATNGTFGSERFAGKS